MGRCTVCHSITEMTLKLVLNTIQSIDFSLKKQLWCYHLMKLAVLGFNTTLTAEVISWRLVTHTFPGFLTPVLTQLFFPKSPTTFLTSFCRRERRKYARKKVYLNRGSNSNHQVMSLTRSQLSHPGGLDEGDFELSLYHTTPTCKNPDKKPLENIVEKMLITSIFSVSPQCYLPHHKQKSIF